MKRADFLGIESEPDKKIGTAEQQTVEGNAGTIIGTSGYVTGSTFNSQSTRNDSKFLDQFEAYKLIMYNAAQAHHKDLYGHNGYYKTDDWPRKK